MNQPNDMTIRDYLREMTPGATVNASVRARMCELLTQRFNAVDCEGDLENTSKICDVETSTTYDKAALDWAFQQAQGSVH